MAASAPWAEENSKPPRERLLSPSSPLQEVLKGKLREGKTDPACWLTQISWGIFLPEGFDSGLEKDRDILHSEKGQFFTGKLPSELSPCLVHGPSAKIVMTEVNRKLSVSYYGNKRRPQFSAPFSFCYSSLSAVLGDQPSLLPVLLIFQHTPKNQ